MLIIKGAGPIAGTLAQGVTWASLFAGVPSLVGAWSTSGLASGSLPSWAATHGTGIMSQVNAAYQPTVATFENMPVLTFGLGKSMRLFSGFTSGSPLTVAIRAYLTDPTTDVQALIGGSSSWRGRFRTTGGGRFDLDNGGTALNRPMTIAGWYNIIAVQSATGATLTVNSGTPTSNANSTGANIANFMLGASTLDAQTENWRGHVSRMAMSTSALSGDNLTTFTNWLNS